MISTHKAEVVPVKLERHENADSLSIVRAFGYTCCVRTQDWKDGDLAAYIPPDSTVNTERNEFNFLAKGRQWERIKAKKLRGVQSFGLLIPAPADAKIGDDVAELLGIRHYDPPEPYDNFPNGLRPRLEAESVPAQLASLGKYDVDSLRRYDKLFEPGEKVIVTEKIHGANARYTFLNGRMYCGSRTEWKKQDAANLWWKILDRTPDIETLCRAWEGYILYGEAYGQVQNLKYGAQKDEVRFAAFDLRRPDGSWVDGPDLRLITDEFEISVPLIAVTKYNFEAICQLAQGQTMVKGANHVREGCVVKPVKERWDHRIGRVQLKVVGLGFLENDK